MKNCLHIYGQPQWHDEVFIVGTTDALKSLRSAIDNALKDGGGSSPSFVNDGEGFYTAVVCLDDQEKFDKLAVPYTEDFAKAHDEPGPWDMLIVQELLRKKE